MNIFVETTNFRIGVKPGNPDKQVPDLYTVFRRNVDAFENESFTIIKTLDRKDDVSRMIFEIADALRSANKVRSELEKQLGIVPEGKATT